MCVCSLFVSIVSIRKFLMCSASCALLLVLLLSCSLGIEEHSSHSVRSELLLFLASLLTSWLLPSVVVGCRMNLKSCVPCRYLSVCFTLLMSRYVGCCRDLLALVLAKLRSGLVYVIRWSFPTILKSACSSLLTGMFSLSLLSALFAALPGVVAVSYVVVPASSNIVVV